MTVKRILFCTDFSENSAPARELAIEFAKAFDAQLFIVHVVYSRYLGYPSFEAMIPVDMTVVEQSIREGAQQQLDAAAEECRRELPQVETRLLTGLPAEQVVEFADEHAIDLIVMGTHGWTGFKHLILGSTAENVLRTANCPVLTVRGPAET
ncbi:MAG: universal stress protein [Desulfomonile sp.]|nr:universal stress protein [Desulfomonile sp.]